MRLFFVALDLAIYALIFVPLYPVFGHGVTVGALIPVVIAGGILGVSGALVAGAVAAVITSVLYIVVDVAPAEAVLRGATGNAIFGAVGALVGWLRELVVALQRERRSLEVALGRETAALQRLARSEALLAHAERAAEMGSWETDLETRRSTWSAGAHRVLGLSPSSETRTFESFMDVVHPADLERVRAVASRGHEVREGYSIEHRVLRADGAVRVLASRVEFIVDPDGRARTIGIGQDITERRELEARLRVADRMASLGTLAGGVAHEINNPLSFVTANLEFCKGELVRATAEGRVADPAAMDEALAEALDGARRIRRIVSDLRTFARSDEERNDPVDVNRVLDSAIALAGNEIRHRAQLVKEYGRVGHALADESRLAQVFVNLLVNGAQAITEGQAARNSIRVRSFREGDRVHVEVQDTGCGIPPEARGHIFDPFFSTKPVGSGMGLGLSICHGIVQRFGGEIAVVDSEVGVGTTFRVSLRVAWPSEETSVVMPSPSSPAPAIAPAAAGRRARVLVIDDEVHVLYALNRLLRRDHDVDLASGAVEALHKLGAGRYDVILCDLMMPDMSGMDLFSAVNGAASEQADRFLFMTGGAFTPRAQQFLESIGRERTLDKPVRKDELLGRIRERVKD